MREENSLEGLEVFINTVDDHVFGGNIRDERRDGNHFSIDARVQR